MESNEGKALYTLVKSATTEITFDHKNRVVKAFDGAADWNVVHKDSLGGLQPPKFLGRGRNLG